MSSHEACQLQNCVDVVSCCVRNILSAPFLTLSQELVLKRTIERDMPGSRTAIIRDMPTNFPDPFCGFHQPQGLIIAEIRYEELIPGRMRGHLVRVR